MIFLVGGDHFRNVGDTRTVAVDAGEQHRPGWGTAGRCVVIGKKQAIPGEGVQGGGVHFAPVGAEIGETQVIGQDQDNVGGSSRSSRLGARRHCHERENHQHGGPKVNRAFSGTAR